MNYNTINMEAIRMKQNGISDRQIKEFMKDSQKYASGDGCLINLSTIVKEPPKDIEDAEDKHFSKQRLKLLRAEKKITRKRFVGKLIKQFVNFQKFWMKEWKDCMWGQFNVFGKIIFLPMTLIGLVFLPIVMTILVPMMKLLTKKPNN